MYIIKMNNWLRNTITSLYNTVTAPIAATRDALAERLQTVRDTASLLYSKTKEKLGYGGDTLKKVVEQQAEQEHEQEETEDLIPVEHEQAFRGSYKSFRVAGMEKSDIDKYSVKSSCRDWVLPRFSYICG